MRIPATRATLLLLLGLAAACQPRDGAGLADRVALLEDSLATLSEALGATAELQPGESAFAVLRVDVGSLALTLDSLSPEGSGSRVSLTIGNLTGAEIDQVVGTVWWGVPAADGSHPMVEQQSRGFTFSQPLAAGAWTPVTFILENVPPAEIGFLRFSDASATSLRLQ